MGNKLDKRENTTFLILGDGECDEGQVWEMALMAAHHKLDNFIVFIDYNKQQLDGYTKDINDLGSIKDKFESFGWYAQDIDGHDIVQIYEAIENAKKQQASPQLSY